MTMTKIQIAKTASKFIVGWSTAYVVSSALRNNTAPDNNLQKAEVAIGSLAVGAIVAEMTEKYTGQLFDKIVVAVENNQEPNVTYIPR